MIRRAFLAGVVVLVASLSQFSCIEPMSDESTACTRAGCISFFTLEFEGVEPGEYSVRYFYGDAGQFLNVSCSVALASADCTSEDEIEYAYNKGALTLGISLAEEMPDEISVQFLRGGVLTEESTFSLEYSPQYMNGPDCGITCYFHEAELVGVGEAF